MRKATAGIYLLLLQFGGLYGLVAALMIFIAVPGALQRGQPLLVPAMIGLVSVLATTTLARPKLLPEWFACPKGRDDLVPVLLVHAALPVLYILPCVSAVFMLDLPDPIWRYLAFVLASGPFLVFGASACLGLSLCLGQAPAAGAPTIAPVRPRRPVMPRLSPEALADLRRQRCS